jgi:hypothetical protein
MVRRLASADAREDTAALSSALAHADDLDMGGCTEEGAGRSLEYWQKVQRARARLVELETEAALQARRESLGLGHVKPPDDFVCPITCSTMEDPVVASDGHSYERSAMQDFLQRGNGRSPLTREPLDPGVLIPNHNLKRRIREHGEEMLQMCEAAVAAMAGAAPPTSHKRARVAEAASAGSSSAPAASDMSTLILSFFQSKGEDSEQGSTVREAADALAANGATLDQVRGVIETLVADGHLYSTIDDDHFKATA